MNRLVRLRGVPRRTICLTLLAVCAVVALGAKCIENTNEVVDDENYTHIMGEFFNETDVQGTNIMVRGMLFDEAGNIVASKDAPTCPPDSQPHSQSVFDIRFDNPGVPAHVRYEVRPISGKTIDAPLPSPEVVVLSTDAIGFEGIPPIPGFPISDEDVFFRFGLRNQSERTYTGVQACAAAYDNAGKVIATESDEVIEMDEEGNIYDATLPNTHRVDLFLQIEQVPASAAYVRGWMWFGQPNDPTSTWQYIMTNPITIQTRKFSTSD